MKRAFVLCLALIVSLFAVTGSIAYFTDNIEAYNNVQAGNLHIVQNEFERIKSSDGEYTTALKVYTQDQVIYPSYTEAGATTQDAEAKKYTYNGTDLFTAKLRNEKLHGFVDKIVTVDNLGTLEAYVRTYVAVPAYNQTAGKAETRIDWVHLDWNASSNGWVVSGPFQDTIDGVLHDIWYATYTQKVEAKSTTPPSLLGFYLDSDVNHNGTNYILKTANGTVNLCKDSELKIRVATEASQVLNDGMNGDTTTVKDAVTSLNTTYGGAPGVGRHPWVTDIPVATTQEELTKYLQNPAYNSQIGLKTGNYTLSGTLPEGIRIFAAGKDVNITVSGKLIANDVEFDGVTFTGDVNFTGWGSFEEVTFTGDCSVILSPADTGTIIFSYCKFGGSYPTAANQITLSNCTYPATTE